METGWYYSSEGSEMDFSQTLSDGYWGSLCSIDNSAFSRLTLHCKENGGANSMNLGADQEQMQLDDQMIMQTDNKQLAEEEESVTATTATAAAADEDSVYEKREPSSSKRSSFYFPTPSFDLDPSKAKLITAMRSHNQNLNPKFSTLERDGDADDVAIMRAMVAVISSTSSSSSPTSSPSVLSNPPSQDYFPITTQVPQRRGNGKFGAFKRYSRSDLTAKSEAEDSCNHGQNMMKRSILMLRRLSSFEGRSRESKSTSNQLHHVISERRRREKLNASFEALRMQLPPGTKKDKTSVLINTKNFVNTLRSRICELKEKNRRLETCLMITDEGNEASDHHGLNGRAQVRLIKCSSSTTTTTSELQQINLTITLRVECDIIELVLHILECLKVIRSINLISVDAYTYSPQMNLFAKASIKFGIKDCDWDEALFHEAMTRAVDDVTLNTATSIISGLSRLF